MCPHVFKPNLHWANSVLPTAEQERAPVPADRRIAKAGPKQETGERGKSG